MLNYLTKTGCWTRRSISSYFICPVILNSSSRHISNKRQCIKNAFRTQNEKTILATITSGSEGISSAFSSLCTWTTNSRIKTCAPHSALARPLTLYGSHMRLLNCKHMSYWGKYDLGNCWSCQRSLDIRPDGVHPADRFYCPHAECGILQPPYDRNHFDQFGLPTDYDIDTNSLTKLYKAIQQRLHPDKAAGLSLREQELADAQSTLINKAYDVLLKPVPRALYLLELNGLSLEDKDIAVDPEYLLNIMDINEEIAGTDDETRLREIFDNNRLKIGYLGKRISLVFKDKDYPAAKQLIADMKYLVTIETKIKEKTYFH